MSKGAKRKQMLTASGLERAVKRILGATTEAISEHDERVHKRAEEMDVEAREHFKDIRAGGRVFKRRFRP